MDTAAWTVSHVRMLLGGRPCAMAIANELTSFVLKLRNYSMHPQCPSPIPASKTVTGA